jgi:F-type H+-transporting ATPase subunit delta
VAKLSAIYAEALYSLAEQRKGREELREQAELARDALAFGDTRRVLLHPHISNGEKKTFLKGIFASRIHEELFNFLCLAIDKNREAFIVPALSALIGIIDHRGSKTSASVGSAAPLSQKQESELQKTLSERMGKQVEITQKGDPSLIGGPCVHAGDFFVDLSVKKRISDLTTYLKEGCGA